MRSPIAPPAWAGSAGAGARWLHTEAGQQVLRSAVWALALASGLGFLIQGANRPADPYLSNQHLVGAPPARPALALVPAPAVTGKMQSFQVESARVG